MTNIHYEGDNPMGNEVIKLTYADMDVIHTKATTARTTNDDALAKIKSALSGSIHVGVAGQTSDQLVAQLFQPYFTELNDIIALFNNSVADGMVEFDEVDVRNARRIGGA